MTHLQAVYLYDDPDTAGLDIDYLAGYLATEAPGLQVHQPWEAQEALRGSVPRALRAPCRHRPLLHSTRALSARSTVARQRNNPA